MAVIRVQATLKGGRTQFDLEVPAFDPVQFAEMFDLLFPDGLWWPVSGPPGDDGADSVGVILGRVKSADSGALALFQQVSAVFGEPAGFVTHAGGERLVVKEFPEPVRATRRRAEAPHPVTCGACQAFVPDAIGDGQGIGSCRANQPDKGVLRYPMSERYCKRFIMVEVAA